MSSSRLLYILVPKWCFTINLDLSFPSFELCSCCCWINFCFIFFILKFLSIITHQSLLGHAVSDALRTILKEEGWGALYRGIAPSLFLVSYCYILFFSFHFFILFSFVSYFLGSGDVCLTFECVHSTT